ncbi:hypothetical protein BJY01DRAFT_248873 [Aspergillus pseudoustus]|uniref:F-box domain-containing protein n=1 Tax=Aspergillus pseudoustus TaxID=1810923 RepID=A0ABR4JV17_9EURO
MPAEVLESVTGQMDIDIIRAFRSTSRYAAQCSVWHFNRNYRNTVVTDHSLEDFEQREKRLRDEPRYVNYIETLSIAAKYEPGATVSIPMGAAFEWERRLDDVLDLTQPAVRKWCDLLGRFTNFKHFHVLTDRDQSKSIASDGLAPTQLSNWDAYLISMSFIRNSGLPVVSLSMFAHKFYRGCTTVGFAPELANEAGVIDGFLPPAGTAGAAGWPHLESLTLREGLANDQTRFRNVISQAPNLKKISLDATMIYHHFRELAQSVDTFKLEELHVSRMFFIPRQVRDLHTALPLLSASLRKLNFIGVRMTNWTGLLRLLRDGGFSALQEITIDGVVQCWRTKELRWTYDPETPLVTAPPGAKLRYKLCKEQGVSYYDMVSYTGSEMENVPDQLLDKVAIVPAHFYGVGSEGVYEF